MSIEFAQYLVERLKQCGVKYVFGVPGDYNLELLDYIERDEHLVWVGNANELNAAYASDGYARVKGGLAVVITTFGVGELSALCGIAGALAERVPVLHIVGAPSRALQSSSALLHHTLNLPTSFSTFSTMSRPLSCSQALLNEIEPRDPSTWTDALDTVLKDVLEQCRPGYVEIPTDAVHHKVSADGLKKLLPSPHAAPPNESFAASQPVGSSSEVNPNAPASAKGQPSQAPSDDVTEYVVEEITGRFAKAKKPIIIVDACAGRFGMAGEVRMLVEKCQIRFFEMGKSMLDEHHPLYGGCYAGANSLQPVREEVESADFVLFVGALKSDFNSGSFSVNIDPKITIELHSFTTNVGYASYPTTDIRHILPLLVPSFGKVHSARSEPHGESLESKITSGRMEPQLVEPKGEEIKHEWFWQRMGRWFADNDIIITETGTSSFGLINVPLPSHSTYVAQILWGAIGWSVGAALGCALAATEQKPRRTVLFVGDGSLQLTLQEIGTMIRHGVKPYLFVINNDGYEIERQIHGWTAKYNDIQLYDHQMLLPFLAGKKSKVPYESIAVHTPAELEALLTNEAFAKDDKIRLVEVYMPRGDAPEGLIRQAKLTAEANEKASEE
ncbi:pyruvate decarboxylase [Saitozyma sp. JCM 24511]|nr:pyruvate decarboxylase [Saitozyma sp. JCM 24511]